MNDEVVGEVGREDASSWRSIGAVALGWAARVEALREERCHEDERRLVPVAWAAE